MGKWRNSYLMCFAAVAAAASAASAVESQNAMIRTAGPAGASTIHLVEYGQPTTMQSIGNSFQRGVDAITSPFRSKPQDVSTQDPTSLSTPARSGPSVALAMARHNEEQGNPPEAAKFYQQAIQTAPRDPRPLAGYARFKATQGDLPEAIELYQKAIRLSPDDAAIHNDMGLSYARARKFNEAAAALGRAVELQPKAALYRNNLAMVLVDLGQIDNAFTHLAAVHSPAVAHYNLGYLLNQKGQTALAVQHFSFALQMEPSLTQAQYWLQRLTPAPAASPQSMAASPQDPSTVRVANRPDVVQLPTSAPSAPQPVAPAAANGPPVCRVEQQLVVTPAPPVSPPLAQPKSASEMNAALRQAFSEPAPAVRNTAARPANLQLLPPPSSARDPQAPLPPSPRVGLQRLPQP